MQDFTASPSAPASPDPACALDLLERAVGAGLWSLDISRGLVHWSPRLADWLDTPSGSTPTPQQALAFVALPWRESLRALIVRCARRGQPFDCEVQMQTSRQARLWVRVLGQAGHDAAGRIWHLQGVVLPIIPRAVADGALLTVDGDGRLSFLNEEAQRLLGQPASVLQGRALAGLFRKSARATLEQQVRAALQDQQPLEMEAQDVGQSRWLSLRGQPFGQGLALELHDVTGRRASQEQLRLLEGSIARLNDLVIITEAGPLDEPGPRIVFVNEAFERRTGYRREEVLGRSPRLLQGPQTQRPQLDQIRSALQEWEPVRVDLVNYRKDGYPYWVDLDISPVWDSARRLTHWVAVGRDVTERKASERKIRHLAFYDPLTGLPNRQLLLERLQATLGRHALAQGGALMFIDLDNFKTLNDTQGHQKGDLLLQQVAGRLRACVAHDDTVARLGGDEFVILLAPRADGDEPVHGAAAAVAQRLLAAFAEPYTLSGVFYHCTCSIGVTAFGPSDGPVSELLKQADLAMYQAKRAGRNTVCFFDPQMQAVASAGAALATDLRQAWREEQFTLDYQPQVDGRGRLTGVEALLRWHHPRRGRVPPEHFIPVAEDSSLILGIGRWVLDTACAQLARWAGQPGRDHLSIAVNVSVRQFRQPEFVEEVMQAIARAGISAHRLKLELTESLLADGIELTAAKMASLRARGVALSLDDFGMGYSSLAYLKHLPLDQLKIDREFVKDLLVDEHDAAIARTIIALAQSLGLDVIAEGVETRAQCDFLMRHGCNAFQGYLFSEPLSPDRLEVFIETLAG